MKNYFLAVFMVLTFFGSVLGMLAVSDYFHSPLPYFTFMGLVIAYPASKLLSL